MLLMNFTAAMPLLAMRMLRMGLSPPSVLQ